MTQSAANTVEFYVKMKDLMSSGLLQLAQTSSNTLVKVQSNIDHVARSNDRLADSFDRVERKSNSSSSTILSNAKKIAAFVGVAAIGTSIASSAASFTKESIQAALKNDMTRQSFGVLTGNKGIGNELANQLNKFQQDTVLGPEVFKNAQTLMSFGIGADKIMPMLKMLGDVSQGDADRMQALTLAFAQTQSAGKLMGQDLLQYVNAGFNPLNELAKESGKSVGELRQEMEKGQISAAQVAHAFELATGKGGLFNGMLDKMGNTTNGRIQQVDGAIESLKINIGNMLKPIVDTTVISFAHFVDVLKKMTDVPVAMQVNQQIANIKALQGELTASNTAQSRRLEILKELEQINPNITKGINAEAIEYGKLAQNITDVVTALNQKKIAASIEEANIGVINKYREASDNQTALGATISKMIAQVPGLAERTDLTIGQKQMEARKYFAKQDANAKGEWDKLTAAATFNAFNNSIKDYNSNVGIINSTFPKVKEVESKIKRSMDVYSSMFGIKEMKAAQGAMGGVGGGGSSTTITTDNPTVSKAAREVTGSGPRTINISGVKFAETVNISGGTASEARENAVEWFNQAFLQLLQSGAKVQG